MGCGGDQCGGTCSGCQNERSQQRKLSVRKDLRRPFFREERVRQIRQAKPPYLGYETSVGIFAPKSKGGRRDPELSSMETTGIDRQLVTAIQMVVGALGKDRCYASEAFIRDTIRSMSRDDRRAGRGRKRQKKARRQGSKSILETPNYRLNRQKAEEGQCGMAGDGSELQYRTLNPADIHSSGKPGGKAFDDRRDEAYSGEILHPGVVIPRIPPGKNAAPYLLKQRRSGAKILRPKVMKPCGNIRYSSTIIEPNLVGSRSNAISNSSPQQIIHSAVDTNFTTISGNTPQQVIHGAVDTDLSAASELLADTCGVNYLDLVQWRAEKGDVELFGGAAARVDLSYREVDFRVPEGFWLSYDAQLNDYVHGKGWDADSPLVSSVKNTLDILWSGFRQNKVGTFDQYHKVLGCYDLPTDEEFVSQFRFFNSGWGTPHQVMMLMFQYIRTFKKNLKGQDVCAEKVENNYGIEDYIDDLLYAKKVKNLQDRDPCHVVVDIWCKLNDDEPRVRVTDYCDDTGNCGRGSKGQRYTWLMPYVWNEDRYWDTRYRKHDYNQWYAKHSFPRIIAPASWVMFRGYEVDYLLYLSRLAMDYGVYLFRLDASEYFRAFIRMMARALCLARYALARINWSLCPVFIHELGHLFLDEDGHCRHDCCMDVMGYRFACKTGADLGLPMPWDFSLMPQSNFFRWSDRYCGYKECGVFYAIPLAYTFYTPIGDTYAIWAETDLKCYYIFSCKTDCNGQMGTDSDFCSTDCRGTDIAAAQEFYDKYVSADYSSLYPAHITADYVDSLNEIFYSAYVTQKREEDEKLCSD